MFVRCSYLLINIFISFQLNTKLCCLVSHTLASTLAKVAITQKHGYESTNLFVAGWKVFCTERLLIVSLLHTSSTLCTYSSRCGGSPSECSCSFPEGPRYCRTLTRLSWRRVRGVSGERRHPVISALNEKCIHFTSCFGEVGFQWRCKMLSVCIVQSCPIFQQQRYHTIELVY